MAEPEKNFLQQVVDWLSSAVNSASELANRYGWLRTVLILLVAASVALWWFWKDIKERPGIAPLTEFFKDWFKRKPVPKARPDRLTIAVARLGNDKDREHEKLLADELEHFEGVETRRAGRVVGSETLEQEKADKQARSLLKKTGADVLIWGSVISLGGKSAMRLYWTPSREVSGVKESGKYLPRTETIALPAEFWSDLKQILGLLTQSRLAELTFGQEGHYVADRLAPRIVQVRALVQSKEGVWEPETLAGLQFSLATALLDYGEQTGTNEPLVESVERLRNVLEQRNCERVPLDWAMTQGNLGIALAKLGEREWGTNKLEEAVSAFQEALQEGTRERVPLQWAETQMNLGSALRMVGLREKSAKQLEDAVKAYREALKEYTRERVPLDWAMTHNNLGTALFALGARARAARGGFGLPRGVARKDPRARAARLGHDAEQSWASARRARGARTEHREAQGGSQSLS
jgi:hypothetical protein